jgi:uncharacterized protein YoxC
MTRTRVPDVLKHVSSSVTATSQVIGSMTFTNDQCDQLSVLLEEIQVRLVAQANEWDAYADIGAGFSDLLLKWAECAADLRELIEKRA